MGYTRNRQNIMEKLELEPGAIGQHNGYAIDYKVWWSESESRNYKLKMEIDDLKAQIDRLKAVLKDSL